MARNNKNLKKLGTRAIYNIALVSDVTLIINGDIYDIPKGAGFEEVYNFLERHEEDKGYVISKDAFGHPYKEYVELTV